MFEMNAEEFDNWRSQIVTSNPGDRMGLRYAPFCFTEHGVLMLSSVLAAARRSPPSDARVLLYALRAADERGGGEPLAVGADRQGEATSGRWVQSG